MLGREELYQAALVAEPLLSGLPSKLASFDLSTNGLCHLDATLHQLQALRALRHWRTTAAERGAASWDHRWCVYFDKVRPPGGLFVYDQTFDEAGSYWFSTMFCLADRDAVIHEVEED